MTMPRKGGRPAGKRMAQSVAAAAAFNGGYPATKGERAAIGDRRQWPQGESDKLRAGWTVDGRVPLK